MDIGVVFPQTEIGRDPGAARAFVQRAEELGYTHLRIYDHVLGAVHEGREPKLTGPYHERSSFHEPFVLFGYLAALTRRIELVTGVIILPQRQTVLVAKQAAEVDILSGGRLRLGVGVGWNWVEYEALNEDFANRGRREEEQVELIRRLWEDEVLDYTGRWHRVDRAGILPRPERRIPIWFGGFSDAAYERAARVGDGFIVGTSSGALEVVVSRLREAVAAAGRDPATFGIDALVQYRSGPDRWAADAASAAALGITHLTVNTMNAELANPDAHLAALETYWNALR
jgi:probable F420-dependent oxidoreductase